jgi:hypothetical protein
VRHFAIDASRTQAGIIRDGYLESILPRSSAWFAESVGCARVSLYQVRIFEGHASTTDMNCYLGLLSCTHLITDMFTHTGKERFQISGRLSSRNGRLRQNEIGFSHRIIPLAYISWATLRSPLYSPSSAITSPGVTRLVMLDEDVRRVYRVSILQQAPRSVLERLRCRVCSIRFRVQTSP